MRAAGDVLRRVAAAVTLLLIFLGPAFVERPVWLYVMLIAASVAWLVSLRFPLDDHGAARLTGLAMMMVLAGIFAPPFFSDDSLRHVHDGFYLLHGIDVYTIPPAHLPLAPGLDRLPNHPDVGTIYFPFTQMQALAGAALSARYGFFAIFASLCAALMYLNFRCASRHERRALALLFFSPAFLIFAVSRHADVQGLLLATAAYLLWRRAITLRSRSAGAAWAAAAGLCAGLLIGLKPEGFVYLLFLGVLVLIAVRQDRHRRRLAGAWFTALFLVTFAQVMFALLVMFPAWEAFGAFLRTARFFTNWFVGYNPVVDLLLWFFDPGLERPWYLAAYRGGVFALAAVLCMILLFRQLQRRPAPSSGSTRTLVLRRWLRAAVPIALGAVILSKGVWHPWYFLWFAPVLGLRREFRTAAWLCAGLVLAYGPVFYLRRDGDWGGMELFYVLALVWIGLGLVSGRSWIFGRVLVDKWGSTRRS